MEPFLDNSDAQGKTNFEVNVKSVSNGLVKLKLTFHDSNLDNFEFEESLIYLKLKHPLFSRFNTIKEISNKIAEKLMTKEYRLESHTEHYDLWLDYLIDDFKGSDCLRFYKIKSDGVKFEKNTDFVVRKAKKEDLPKIYEFIYKLADYQKMRSDVFITPEILEDKLFGTNPVLQSFICTFNEIFAGFSIFYYNFSVFSGSHGVWLENLYIDPIYRRFGLAKKMMEEISRIAGEQCIKRISWWVLHTNEPAFQFYKKLGSVPLDHWRVFRISNQSLENLAKF